MSNGATKFTGVQDVDPDAGAPATSDTPFTDVTPWQPPDITQPPPPTETFGRVAGLGARAALTGGTSLDRINPYHDEITQ